MRLARRLSQTLTRQVAAELIAHARERCAARVQVREQIER
jgi:hypothetical protein